jgi:CHAT domain-containing protein
MKYIFSALLSCLPFFVFAQIPDSAAVARQVDSLVDLNAKLIAQQKFDAAIQVIEAAEKIATGAFGQNSTEYGNCLNGHGVLLYAKGLYAEAEPFLVESKVIQEKVMGKDNRVYASRLKNLAVLYKAMGRYESAELMYLEAKTIQEKVVGKTNPEYANILNNLGNLYLAMGRLTLVRPLLLEAKDIREKVLGKEHPDYASSVGNLANLEKTEGHYDDAERLYLEAKDLQEKAVGKKHPAYARSLNNLAALYLAIGHYEPTEPLLLEAKAIRETVLGKEHPDYSRNLGSLAWLYTEMGRYEVAETFYLETKSIQEKALTKEHPSYAATVHNLAVLYNLMGRFEDAEKGYLEAKSIQEKTLGKENYDYARSLNNLAFLYYKMGRYNLSEQLYLEAKPITEKTLGKEHPDYAQILSDIASLYLAEDKYEAAEQFYLQATAILEKNRGKEQLQFAKILSNLGILYVYMRRYPEADTIFTQTQNIIAKLIGKEHPDYAPILNNRAVLYATMEDYEKAVPLYLESMAVWTKTLGQDHPQYIKSLNSLALSYEGGGDYETAAPLILEASRLQQVKITTAAKYLSESELSLYGATFSKNFDHFFSFAQIVNSANPLILRASYNNALFYKDFLLDAVSKRNNLTQSDTTAARLSILQKSYLRCLSREYAKPIVQRNTTQIANWEEKANSVEKDLIRSVAGYSDLVKQVSWQEVQQKLITRSAAIEFISYRYYTPKLTDSVMYAALVLFPKDTTPHFIPLFEERQLQALLNRPGLSEKLVLKDLYGNSPELRRLIWDPLKPLLRDVKTIYYSPSGLLHRINPGALLDESGQTLSEGRQWVRVGCTRELVTSRLADHSFALTPEKNNNSTLTAMVYGGITYDMDSLTFSRAYPIGTIDSTEMPLRKDGAFSYIISEQPDASDTRGNPDGTWSTLAATSKEADEVSAMLAGAGFSAQKRQGFYASEEQFKQVGVNAPSPRVLHLATHGFSYPDPKKTPPKGFADSEPTYKMLDDPMLRSGLVLAGANYYWKNKRPLTNREDGVLVAYEVRDLNLRNTELAVLSACQTGFGDVVGSEGVYGLQRAFRIAGAKFLIVSLWQVPDEQTQELMRLFYQNWLDKNESLRDAFNHAQQALREKESSPFMWAGFVLIE